MSREKRSLEKQVFDFLEALHNAKDDRLMQSELLKMSKTSEGPTARETLRKMVGRGLVTLKLVNEKFMFYSMTEEGMMWYRKLEPVEVLMNELNARQVESE
jgi:predicted transcriptional regulator